MRWKISEGLFQPNPQDIVNFRSNQLRCHRVDESEVDFRLIGEFSDFVLNLIVDEWQLVIDD